MALYRIWSSRGVLRCPTIPKRQFILDSRYFGITDEQKYLQDTALAFAKTEIAPRALEWDRTHTLPCHVLQQAGNLGFGALYVSEKYGSGLSRLDTAIIMEALSTGCPALAAFISIHNMCCGMIDKWGLEGLKDEWMPPLGAMEKLCSYCLTEPTSGSDAAALRTTAKKEGDVYVVNGTKSFISGAGAAGAYLVMCRTGAPGASGISALLIPGELPGISFGTQERKMGWNCQPTRQLILENVKVPVSCRLGDEGQGFAIAMGGLDGGRVNIAACSIGGAVAAYEKAMRYGNERAQFDTLINDFQNSQFKLAEVAAKIHASRTVVRQAAAAIDAASPLSTAMCAAAKLTATEQCFDAIDTCLQLHGGYGYLADYGVEKLLRDTRVHRILEGTNEIMRLICYRELLKEWRKQSV